MAGWSGKNRMRISILLFCLIVIFGLSFEKDENFIRWLFLERAKLGHQLVSDLPSRKYDFRKKKMRIAKVASYPLNTWVRIYHCSRLSQYLWRQGLESLTASLSSSHISLVREERALALPVLLCSCASRRARCALCLAIAGRGSEGDKRLFAQTVELHGAELCRFKSSYQFHVTLLLLQVTRRIAQGLSAFT